jgi:hypothetical protein
VLYASSYPRLEIRRVQWAPFSEAEAEVLLGGNACEVFGLSELDEAAVAEE